MNIAEILKNVSKGTKLYSPIFGDVTFKDINSLYIEVLDLSNIVREFYHDGRFYLNGECMLFPSKDNRDWNTFTIFKKGDVLISKNNKPFIFNGEIHAENICGSYCGIDMTDIVWTSSNNWTVITKARRATEEEKSAFFIRLREAGYEWDASTFTLRSIKKFDISKLKPFDKVLVRDTNYIPWRCAFFDSIIDNREYKFRTTSGIQSQCIPYNEETRHLVGTKEDCPEYYKTW